MSTITVDVVGKNIWLGCSKGGVIGVVKNQKRMQKVQKFGEQLGKIFKIRDEGSVSGDIFQKWSIEGFTKDSIDKITRYKDWSIGKDLHCKGSEVSFITKKLADAAGFNFKGKETMLDSDYERCLECCLT